MSRYKVLNDINDPSDLKGLERKTLVRLCAEIRHFIIESVSKTGGHLASNLGAVELTVAIHKVFESPKDQIVWDVGHQSYTHKILTGRKNSMNTLRQRDGIGGFTKQNESVHDAFVSGHASTSISVAAGIAQAKRLLGEEGHVIAVIGDGALTGGEAYEGLNNAAQNGNKLIIIINDNEMSISKNVGSITKYLTKLRTNKSYFKLKDITKSAVGSLPFVGDALVDIVASAKTYVKNAVYNTSFFEDMGYVHMGPVDGHSMTMLCDVLERAKGVKGPVIIHVETMKGKGYSFAEKNPGSYHGVAPFDPKVGCHNGQSDDNYSCIFGKELTKLAKKDDKIAAITAAMKDATGLNYFADEFGKEGRFFDVGIAEQHGVTFCASLASKGILPVFAIYSSFLQRAYDQLLHDVSIEPKHVVMAVDRAGLVGEDGETHQGLFDCALLSSIPGSAIYSPASYNELAASLESALYDHDGLVAVRYPRGKQPPLPIEFCSANSDYVYCDSREKDLLIVTYGRVAAEVYKAVEDLAEKNIKASILKLTKIWPIDIAPLQIALGYNQILFVEEGIRSGGIGEHFLLKLNDSGYKGCLSLLAVEDKFIKPASVLQQMNEIGIDSEGITRYLDQIFSERKSS